MSATHEHALRRFASTLADASVELSACLDALRAFAISEPREIGRCIGTAQLIAGLHQLLELANQLAPRQFSVDEPSPRCCCAACAGVGVALGQCAECGGTGAVA